MTIRAKLGIASLAETIRKRKEKWKGHLQHMDEEIIIKMAHQYKPIGKRDVDRPMKRWL